MRRRNLQRWRMFPAPVLFAASSQLHSSILFLGNRSEAPTFVIIHTLLAIVAETGRGKSAEMHFILP